MAVPHLLVNISQKALIVEDDKLLLVREDEGWELPGGRVDQGETNLIAALKRELMEELFLDINQEQLFFATIFKKKNGDDILVLVYKCSTIQDLNTLRINDPDVLEWKFFSRDELKNLTIYPNSIEAIDNYLRN
jgi:ADP-ribose pyrophosphatase YjhB (NUDIX family)